MHRWGSLLTLVVGILTTLTVPEVARPAPSVRKKAPFEESVDKALAFLHNNQNPDGSWSAGRNGPNTAVSALAVMAFLSAGHVPGEGRYGKAVEKGVRWVLSTQQGNGLLANEGGHEMYHHGIATLMLAEVSGMCEGRLAKDVRVSLEKSLLLILQAQRTTLPHRGGWRYRVAHTDGSDISVTGWQVMSLRAAKNLGCDVPPETIDRAVEFIKRCQDNSTGGFRYLPYSYVTVGCTGTSVLALELCGKDLHHSPETLRGGAYLIRSENLPRWDAPHFFYGVYYGAQATFQLGGNYWETYRPRLHQVLLKNQSSNGSWLGTGYDASFGPSYCTSMAVLALTVEYRYLPIYQRGEESSGQKK